MEPQTFNLYTLILFSFQTTFAAYMQETIAVSVDAVLFFPSCSSVVSASTCGRQV